MDDPLMKNLDPHGQPLIRAYNARRLADRTMDELIGLSKGLIADSVISQQEAEFLQNWLEKNLYLAQSWPANILYARIQEMLSDGVLDKDEQAQLMELLLDLTGEKLANISNDNQSTALPFDNPQPTILFQEKAFCFTGKFAYGTRTTCQQAVLLCGSAIRENITKDLDYLVIGAIGSADWIHSTHGRKIEKAVEYREQGCPIAIISEEHWTNYIESFSANQGCLKQLE